MDSYLYQTECREIGYFQIDEPNESGDYKIQYCPANNNSMDYVGATTWKTYSTEFPDVITPTKLNAENLHRLISLILTKNDSRGVFNVIKTLKSTNAGSFTPRINRGEPGLFYRQYLEPEMSEEVRAYENIINSLEDIFQTIEPENGNLSTYGNKIRELIIIACT